MHEHCTRIKTNVDNIKLSTILITITDRELQYYVIRISPSLTIFTPLPIYETYCVIEINLFKLCFFITYQK